MAWPSHVSNEKESPAPNHISKCGETHVETTFSFIAKYLTLQYNKAAEGVGMV
jgi:hypothetical protein